MDFLLEEAPGNASCCQGKSGYIPLNWLANIRIGQRCSPMWELSARTVSYTHLDVYKRQEWNRELSFSIIRLDTYRVRHISPPSGRSTLMTRAPKSARRRVAEGADKNWLKSSMVIPSNGFMLPLPPLNEILR